MAKESRIDKKAGKAKTKGQIPLTEENQNQHHNVKKQSLGPNTDR